MMSLLSQKIQRLQRSMRAVAKRTKKLETRLSAYQVTRTKQDDEKHIQDLQKRMTGA